MLIQKLDSINIDGDSFSSLLKSLITRNLERAREETFFFFDSPDYEDNAIAEALYNGTIQYDDVIANVGRKCLAEAVSQYLEYLKAGNTNLIEDATQRCRQVAELGRNGYHVDLWFNGVGVAREDLGW